MAKRKHINPENHEGRRRWNIDDTQFEDGKEAWNAFELYYHDKELRFWKTMAVAFLIASGMLAITVLILCYMIHCIFESSMML